MWHREAGWIYAIGIDGTSQIKVGYTTHPVEKRLVLLSRLDARVQGRPLRVLAAVAVPRAITRIERRVHDLLCAYWLEREWFDMPWDEAGFLACVRRAQADVYKKIPAWLPTSMYSSWVDFRIAEHNRGRKPTKAGYMAHIRDIRNRAHKAAAVS